jgi:hypothetical protein
VPFQRTWEDALAVAKETGRPILVCVNMDGEIASENWAGKRYRDPEHARMMAPYVTVIASVYRHTPRDHDDEGRRVICPRFGSVTCGEHIAIEPILYEKYFDGRRIAPRHVLIELDGKESFDVFYANDVASVFTSIVDGMKGRPDASPLTVKGDRPVVDRVASRDSRDRDAVEAAYAKGDAAQRKALLEAAAAHAGAAPVDLLRLAVFGLDPALARLGREALARTDAPGATGLLADALRSPLDAKEREALLAALDRIGKASPRARWISVVHRGLGGESKALDVKGWLRAGAEYPADPEAAKEAAGAKEPAAGAGADPARAAEAAEALALAESTLERAMEERHREKGPAMGSAMMTGLLFEDARRAALRAEELGAGGWRTKAVLCLCEHDRGRFDEAYAHAAEAVKGIPPGDAGWISMAVITTFAEGRWKAIKRAVTEKKPWPPEWLTDLHSAYSILLHHPRATDARIAWHYDLLDWLGAADPARKVLGEGMGRFPDSEALHERFRRRTLAEGGVAALENAYGALLKGKERLAPMRIFAARASLLASAELRQNRRPDEALAAIDRAVAHLEAAAAADPSRRDEVDRAVALALTGRARICFQKGDDEGAAEAVAAALRRAPGSAEEKDELGFTPAETARILLARLKERGKEDLAKRVAAALALVDPSLPRADAE